MEQEMVKKKYLKEEIRAHLVRDWCFCLQNNQKNYF